MLTPAQQLAQILRLVLPPVLAAPAVLLLAAEPSLAEPMLAAGGVHRQGVLAQLGAPGVVLQEGRWLAPGVEIVRTMFRPDRLPDQTAPRVQPGEPDRLVLEGVRIGLGGVR